MRPIIAILLLLITAASLTAATTKVIVVGAFHTPEGAQQRVDTLKGYLRYEPESYALQRAGYYTYGVRSAAPYYVAVLYHFRNFDELLTVRNSIKKIYPDAYVKNNMNFTRPLGAATPASSAAGSEAAVFEPAAAPASESVMTATDTSVVETVPGTEVTAMRTPGSLSAASITPETTGPSFLPLLIAELLGGAAFIMLFAGRRQPVQG
ncbi:hypothetical protein [Sulfurimonas diazotrophicus]|uniref:SPOR domain-containing protein n=1 Tax=Sulfurimonas diazotrophicus TaxID=3131939 RepID=A0ABZ3H8N4_9BACT